MSTRNLLETIQQMEAELINFKRLNKKKEIQRMEQELNRSQDLFSLGTPLRKNKKKQKTKTPRKKKGNIK